MMKKLNKHDKFIQNLKVFLKKICRITFNIIVNLLNAIFLSNEKLSMKKRGA